MIASKTLPCGAVSLRCGRAGVGETDLGEPIMPAQTPGLCYQVSGEVRDGEVIPVTPFGGDHACAEHRRVLGGGS